MTREELLSDEYKSFIAVIDTISKIPDNVLPIVSHVGVNIVFIKTVNTMEEVINYIDLVTDSFNLFNYYMNGNDICFSHKDEESGLKYNFYCLDVENVLENLLMLNCKLIKQTRNEPTIICLNNHKEVK